MSVQIPDLQTFTVGWICALPLEMAAARAVLDEFYGRPQDGPTHDHNNYLLGRIGAHNVVIACLPAGSYGTSSAATVAAKMLSRFAIRVGLLVGIGGGVPRGDIDIRLGDVVVSKPGPLSGGVVQYDFGKTVSQGRLIRTGALNKPPQVLLAAVSSLEAEHMIEENKIRQFLSDAAVQRPRMKTSFAYPGPSKDRLYRAAYVHVEGQSTCELCEESELENRPAREDDSPQVHYGIIASGNQVMKDGATRDRLKEELNVLCFEMEAAGLMDTFPCLVIRGICDYSDSHKNDCWQKYAAGTAAAYAKELLGIIPTTQLETTPTVAEAMKAGTPGITFQNVVR